MAQNTTGAPPGVMDISIGGELYNELTGMWLLVCAFLVFFMQVSPAARPPAMPRAALPALAAAPALH